MTNYVYAGFKYILLVIDVHSRYLGAFPLKEKTAANYVKAFRAIIMDQMDGIWPERLNCDNEYDTGAFKALLDKNGVHSLIFSQVGQPYKNAIVERVIRTMRSLIARWREGDPEGGANWPLALPELVYNYNHTYHTTIKNRPMDVWNQKEPNRQKLVWVPNKLKVGDRVRYLMRDRVSALNNKIDTLLWSDSIYTIAEPSEGARWLLSEYSVDGKRNPYPENKYMEYELKLVSSNEEPAVPQRRAVTNAQQANAAVRRRLVREDIGKVGEDVGGRPVFTQLVLRGQRERRPTNFYVEEDSVKQYNKRKRGQ